jgi:hypothetical protein
MGPGVLARAVCHVGRAAAPHLVGQLLVDVLARCALRLGLLRRRTTHAPQAIHLHHATMHPSHALHRAQRLSQSRPQAPVRLTCLAAVYAALCLATCSSKRRRCSTGSDNSEYAFASSRPAAMAKARLQGVA